MKRIVLVIVCLVVLTGTSFAQHIGPGTPSKNWAGNVTTPNVGIGYSYLQSEWEGVDVEQNQIYAHIGAVFGDVSTPSYEVFLRLGGADLQSDDIFDFPANDIGLNDQDYDGGWEPMFAAGIKGELFQGQMFGLGAVLQAAYMNSFEDDVSGTTMGVDYKATVTVEDMWQVDLAFPIQTKYNENIFYFGPVFYYNTADAKIDARASAAGITETLSAGDNIDEDHNVGGYAGAAFRFQNVSIEVEAQYRSDLSASTLLTFTF